jgi:hypothetical protein
LPLITIPEGGGHGVLGRQTGRAARIDGEVDGLGGD